MLYIVQTFLVSRIRKVGVLPVKVCGRMLKSARDLAVRWNQMESFGDVRASTEPLQPFAATAVSYGSVP